MLIYPAYTLAFWPRCSRRVASRTQAYRLYRHNAIQHVYIRPAALFTGF